MSQHPTQENQSSGALNSKITVVVVSMLICVSVVNFIFAAGSASSLQSGMVEIVGWAFVSFASLLVLAHAADN